MGEPGVVPDSVREFLRERGAVPVERLRGDVACPTLLGALDSANVDVRWTALSLGLELGCVDTARREAIAATDPDFEIRQLALR